MDYPRAVKVVYPDGMEETATAVDPTHVDVGPPGLFLKLRDTLEIDGTPHLVASFTMNIGRETSVRVRLQPITPPSIY